MNRDWLVPDWRAPASVQALVTTRSGGVSQAPWDTFNPATHVGDDPAAVAENRHRLAEVLGPACRPVQWLNQVHGSACVVVESATGVPDADAAYTRTPGQPIAVLTADCLPLFITDRAGTEIAVVHAGWRGLVAGVIESALAHFRAPPQALLAWMGPAIGPQAFQVGAEVREAFLQASRPVQQVSTAAAFCADAQGRYRADIYQLARLRLAAGGVQAVGGGGLCTVADRGRFYSWRRDGVTGRMASVIVLHQDAPATGH